jgi:hypothetical protein
VARAAANRAGELFGENNMNRIDLGGRPRGGDRIARMRITIARDRVAEFPSLANVARTRARARTLAAFTCAAAVLATSAQAQVTFSIDWKGPTISMSPSGGGPPITEGDILMPPPGGPAFGPLPKPQMF